MCRSAWVRRWARPLPRVLLSVVLSIGAMPGRGLAASSCGCSGNPGTVTSDATGPCIRYPAPSGSANDVVFRFDAAYRCGRFASGDYFVVADAGSGKATLTSIEPVYTGSGRRHGAAVNHVAADASDPQPWDGRLGTPTADLALPYGARAGDSILKYVSFNPGGDCYDGTLKSCGQFAAVLTVLDTVPASPSTTFRPPFLGTDKPLFSTSVIPTQLLGRLSSGAALADPIDLATAQAWTRHLRLDYTRSSVFCDLITPRDATPYGKSWSSDIWVFDLELFFWLNLADVCQAPPCSAQQDLDAKLPVLIGYLQNGIDVWAADHLGVDLFRGGGGNGGGKLLEYVFTATLLDSAEMKADLARIDPGHFFETGSYYRGRNGVALWGQLTGSDADYWSDLANPPGQTKTIRDPYGWIDGGGEIGGAYQDNTAKQTEYTALLLRLMPELAANWPQPNRDLILEYADRWVSHGAWTRPDPCAPVAGTYGASYGPDDQGGCIAGSGRHPELDGANMNGGNRQSRFGEQMWAAFRSCSESCTCPGQSCTSAVPGEDGSGGGGSRVSGSGSGCGSGAGGIAGLAGLLALWRRPAPTRAQRSPAVA